MKTLFKDYSQTAAYTLLRRWRRRHWMNETFLLLLLGNTLCLHLDSGSIYALVRFKRIYFSNNDRWNNGTRPPHMGKQSWKISERNIQWNIFWMEIKVVAYCVRRAYTILCQRFMDKSFSICVCKRHSSGLCTFLVTMRPRYPWFALLLYFSFSLFLSLYLSSVFYTFLCVCVYLHI